MFSKYIIVRSCINRGILTENESLCEVLPGIYDEVEEIKERILKDVKLLVCSMENKPSNISFNSETYTLSCDNCEYVYQVKQISSDKDMEVYVLTAHDKIEGLKTHEQIEVYTNISDATNRLKSLAEHAKQFDIRMDLDDENRVIVEYADGTYFCIFERDKMNDNYYELRITKYFA